MHELLLATSSLRNYSDQRFMPSIFTGAKLVHNRNVIVIHLRATRAGKTAYVFNEDWRKKLLKGFAGLIYAGTGTQLRMLANYGLTFDNKKVHELSGMSQPARGPAIPGCAGLMSRVNAIVRQFRRDVGKLLRKAANRAGQSIAECSYLVSDAASAGKKLWFAGMCLMEELDAPGADLLGRHDASVLEAGARADELAQDWSAIVTSVESQLGFQGHEKSIVNEQSKVADIPEGKELDLHKQYSELASAIQSAMRAEYVRFYSRPFLQ
eukprot:3214826-Amphidinium_carterae.2